MIIDTDKLLKDKLDSIKELQGFISNCDLSVESRQECAKLEVALIILIAQGKVYSVKDVESKQIHLVVEFSAGSEMLSDSWLLGIISEQANELVKQ